MCVTSPIFNQSLFLPGCQTSNSTALNSVVVVYNEAKNVRCVATLLAAQWAVSSYSCVFRDDDVIGVDSAEWAVTGVGDATLPNVAVMEIIPHPQVSLSFFYVKLSLFCQISRPNT